MSHSSLDRTAADPGDDRRRPRLRVVLALLFGLLVSMVPLTVSAASSPATSPSAAGQLVTLFDSMSGERTVKNADSVPVGPSSLGHFRAAMAFTPTVSGLAQVLSMRGRCVIPYPSGTTCQGFGKVTIQADAGGRPSGRILGAMGFYLADSLSNGSPVKKECGTISPAPNLTAGTKYWAVMTSDDQIGWDQWKEDQAEVLQTLNDNPWEESFNPKTLALRIDSGSDVCVSVAVPNPSPGTTVADMFARTNSTTFNTITMSNSGVVPLTLSGATFTGADAGVFSLLDSEPGALAHPFPFPRQVGVGGVSILYVACKGGTVEKMYRASLTLETSDPAMPKVTYPVECLVDNTPPTVGFTIPQADGLAGWFKTSPVPLTVYTNDPPANLVTFVSCSDGNPGTWGPKSAATSILSASVVGEGAHTVSCSARDIAGNWSGGYPLNFKIDSQPPVAVPTVTPAPTADGWNNSAATLTFACSDPVPGSGVSQPASGGGTVSTETAGTNFTSSGCTDVAGHVATPLTVTVRVDSTPPAIEGATVTPAPNGSGWNNTDVSVSFTCVDKGAVQSGIKSSPAAVAVKDNTPGWVVSAKAADCVDKAANKAPAGTTKTVKIDKTAPSTDVDSGPALVTTSASATFKYHGSDSLSGVAKFECRLDGGAFSACPATGKTYSGLAEGAHSFDVRAFDVAGNQDGTPATMAWTIDTSAPETSVMSSPDAVTSATSATITYRDDGSAGAGYECRLDDAVFQTCPAAGVSYTNLAAGGHRFEVRAVDAVGNVDSSPAVATWTIDLVAPDSTIANGPSAQTRAAEASFTFDAVDTGGSTVAGYQCRLDAGTFEDCASPFTVTGLTRTAHTFQVRALDRVGNVESTPAEHSWTVLAFFAADDTATALEDTAVAIDVAGNDVAAPGTQLTLAPTGPSSAMGGAVSANENGTLQYVPPADFHGTDTFAYTFSNGTDTSEATVTVTVATVNDRPTFTPGGAVTVNEDAAAYRGAWASGISAGPTEVGQHVRFVIDGLTNPQLFSEAPALSATGDLTFTPARNANGTATITARLVDDGGRANGGVDASEPVEFTIRVNAVNDAPTIAVAPVVTCANTSATLQVRVSDVDSNLSTLGVSPAVSDRQVRASSAGTGSLRRVTISGLNHATRPMLTVRVTDGSGSASTAVGVVVGTDRGERLSGSAGSNLIFGRGGSDTLNGAGGNDLICGGAGADRMSGGPGSDVCDGGSGTDRATACERKIRVP
jgi:hypothetical protein